MSGYEEGAGALSHANVANDPDTTSSTIPQDHTGPSNRPRVSYFIRLRHESLQIQATSTQSQPPHPERLPRERIEGLIPDPTCTRKFGNESKVDSLAEAKIRSWQREHRVPEPQDRQPEEKHVPPDKQGSRATSNNTVQERDEGRAPETDRQAIRQAITSTDTSDRGGNNDVSLHEPLTLASPVLAMTSPKGNQLDTLLPARTSTDLSAHPFLDGDLISPTQSQHSFLPLHTSAFEFAMKPFLLRYPSHEAYMHAPSTTDSNDLFELLSPRVPPDPDEESTQSSGLFASSPPHRDIPPAVESRHAQETLLKRVRVSNALTRCWVIARSVWELEHNPWKSKASVYKEYSRIRKVAEHALDIALQLRSDGLQARCYYWIGKACGGQKFWDEALPAFRQARDLNPMPRKPSANKDGGKRIVTKQEQQYCGLKDHERCELRFLLKDAEIRLQKESEKYRNEECTASQSPRKVVEGSRSPPWPPDMEGVVRVWAGKRKGVQRYSGTASGLAKEDDGNGEVEGSEDLDRHGKKGLLHDYDAHKHWFSGPFTVEEQWYIKHGGRMPKGHVLPPLAYG